RHANCTTRSRSRGRIISATCKSTCIPRRADAWARPRTVPTTIQPLETNNLAVARPIPPEIPVINTTGFDAVVINAHLPVQNQSPQWPAGSTGSYYPIIPPPLSPPPPPLPTPPDQPAGHGQYRPDQRRPASRARQSP